MGVNGPAPWPKPRPSVSCLWCGSTDLKLTEPPKCRKCGKTTRAVPLPKPTTVPPPPPPKKFLGATS
jgi:hypothetical protein